MDKFIIDVIGGLDGETIAVSLEDVDDACRLHCHVRGKRHTIEAGDFFEALLMLRRDVLEPLGLIPVCYGASLDVWPSGMARAMGRGLKAYRTVAGRSEPDLVCVFDTGEDVIPALVEDQRRFSGN